MCGLKYEFKLLFRQWIRWPLCWLPGKQHSTCYHACNVLFLSMVMFPHELKIQAFLIIYCHWERCFGRLPMVWPRWLWSTHLCICVCTPSNSRQSCHQRTGLRWWFIHKRASFNYSQIKSHGYPGGAAALQRQWAIRSEPRVTSQTTLRFPRLFIHVNRISIFSARTKEISAHLVCHSWPNKPVYVLNTAGTLGYSWQTLP